MRYFEIVDSFEVPDRWHLSTRDGAQDQEVDPRSFTEGRTQTIRNPIPMVVTEGAVPLSFTLGPFEIPVVNELIALVLRNVADRDIQLIPATNHGVDGREIYWIVNVISVKQCLDLERSEISYWRRDDGFPEKTGTIFGVGKIILRKTAIGDAQVFRILDWLQPI